MKKKWIKLWLLFTIPVCGFSQTAGYRFYCKPEPVTTPGFYKIDFTPAITAHLKTDYSDIRIINDSGKWVPHILTTAKHDYTATSVITYLKFSVSQDPAANTEVLIESAGKNISNLNLTIANTAAERFCTLSGSNDKNNWFVINDSILLHPETGENTTSIVLSVDFPVSNYLFYKLVIINKNKDPFNIRSVHERTSVTSHTVKTIDNPATLLLQKDNGNISYIQVVQQQPYQFDMISLKAEGVKYYSREVELFVPAGEGHSFSAPGNMVHSFTISNNSTMQFPVPLVKSSVFYLLIKNQDNLPLKITAVKTTCNDRYITAYLEKGNYRLIMDNPGASAPNYDLSGLSLKLQDSVPSIPCGEIVPLNQNEPPVVAAKNNNWLIWSAIAVALIVLLFFTTRMIKEVDKRKTI